MSSPRTPSGPSATSARARLLLGGLGVVIGLYGAWLLLSRQDLSRLLDVGIWLVVGAVVHDAVIAPVVLALAVAARRLPTSYRRASTAALVVLGSLTLLAVPVLGRFGARSDNPTLLDRPYVVSWLVLAVVTVIAVLVVGRFGGSAGGRAHPPGDGVSGSGSNRRSG